ncbi:hypothetical protein QKU58_gp083 [Pyramimonas orientalis virus]|uniref:Uncharacterized protein n=1 Tax=Pyramimonas orientalis virus 01B TaxID=3134525 RepID=A0A7M3UNI9_9VIRU|nr:hypothetical protein QKU58_gp083 [Pyramimonas orientalis virus]QOI90248.1 hypothetical protein HWQ62_00111 [Pyramimonas orientalis virus]
MLLQKQFWMFCVLLMIITLLSSFGGGIRYRENFLEEVYDLNDITSELENTNNFYPINTTSEEVHTNLKIEEEIMQPKPTLPVQPKPTLPVQPKPTLPVQLPEPKGLDNSNTSFQVIEAYSGESFASV